MISLDYTYNLAKETLSIKKVAYENIFALESGSIHSIYGPNDEGILILLQMRLTSNNLKYKSKRYGNTFILSFKFDTRVENGDHLRYNRLSQDINVELLVRTDALKTRDESRMSIWWNDVNKYGINWFITMDNKTGK